jgi:hypothetical protein
LGNAERVSISSSSIAFNPPRWLVGANNAVVRLSLRPPQRNSTANLESQYLSS